MKKCAKCKTEKEISDFGENKQTKDGKNYNCKQCERNRNDTRAGKIVSTSEFFQHQKLATI